MLAKDGETHCRPIFILADDFVKTFRVKRARIHSTPQLTPSEEINYSLLAIRYSKMLTKDMVFAGLRDVFRKIGAFISRGYEMEIDFTFGVLRAKESRVSFVFNQSRLLQILPEGLGLEGVYASTEQPLAYVIQEDEPQGSSRQRTGTMPQSSSAQSFRPSTSQSALPSARRPPLIPALSFQQTQPQVQEQEQEQGVAEYDDELEEEYYQPSEPEQEQSPSLQELMNMISAHRSLKTQVKSQAKDRVMAQAFQRCLADMENDASVDDRRKFEEMRKTATWKASTLSERDKMKGSVAELKRALDQQMEENRIRMEADKQEKLQTMMRFILPENAGMAPSPLGAIVDENGKVMNGRQRIAKDLATQIANKAESKERSKSETIKKERDYMARLAVETELAGAAERRGYLEKQKALVEAWERDGHVRNIRKLQPLGSQLVHDYISKHLQEPELSMDNIPKSMDQQLRMSIGYDPRKGKI